MSLIMNFLALVHGTLRRAWLRLSRGLRLALRVASLALIAAPAMAATYSVNGDGTVTDASTGLTWMRCSVGQDLTSSTCSGIAATSAADSHVHLPSENN